MTTTATEVQAPAPTIDIEAVRKDFPILDQSVNGHPLVYLDNAASSQKPVAVLEAMERYYRHDHANVHRGIHELSNRATLAYEAARERVARYLHAETPSEIVFTRGTTEGINLVAAAWGGDRLKPGDTILLTEMEHHSNIVPWQLIGRRTGARLKYVPVTGAEGLLALDRLEELMTEDVRLMAFTHVSNTLGTINPAAEICERASNKGITTLVDAAQSAGHMPVDVQDIGCDFLAFSSHKICGPTGLGVLYGRRDLLDQMSPYQGGGEMISTVDFFESTWNDVPHKFEAGTPNMAGAIGLHAALDYLDGIGRDVILRHDQELAAYAYARLSELDGIRIFGPAEGRSGVVSFLLDDVHAHDLVTLADQKGIALRGGHHCNQPLMGRLGVEATARASFYVYNTRAEVDRLVESVLRIQRLLAS